MTRTLATALHSGDRRRRLPGLASLRALAGGGSRLLCVDNFFTGRKANVAHLFSHPCFELLRHDVTFPLYVEVDWIFNLACPASPIHYQRDPVQTTQTNVHGAINMLCLAKRTSAKILQASTSEVYGDPEVDPQTESMGVASIRPASAPATTRASAAPRRCSSTITASTACASTSRASSTPTVRVCIQRMDAWYQTSLFRRLEVRA